MPRFSFLLAILLIVPLVGAHAQLQPNRDNAIATELLAERPSVAPGESVTLAIRMEPEPGWHGYWRNPGEAGLPDRWEWALPEEAEIGELRYPVPERLVISGIMNYVFERDYALLAEFTAPNDAEPGDRLTVGLSGEWLACTDEICVPESGEMTLELAVAQPGTSDQERPFDGWRAELARPLGSEARFETTRGMLRLGIPFPENAAIDDPYFFPITDRVADYGAEQAISRTGSWLIVEVPAGADAGAADGVSGLLKIGEGDGLLFEAVPGEVPAAGQAVGSGTAAPSLVAILLGAVIGGLLLNIMPCVFPILSLKALSLAKSGGDPGEARREALAYTAGAVAMCLTLGATLLALRAGGAAVGWAFQLQDPRMIFLLLMLFTAITANLAGLFELPALAVGSRRVESGGTAGSFGTGALAAFVATPCTGPFMAVALGAALVLPAAQSLAIFAGLGLGLALPFLAIGFVPALRRRLPRPGPWLARFRRWMALPMGLTGLALVWLLSRQVGLQGASIGITVAIALTAILWAIGRRQRHGVGSALLVLPALLLVAVGVLLTPAALPASDSAADTLPGAEAFSEERLAALRAEGRPVFVYFTADWCISCKANEAGAMARTDVAAHFVEEDIAVLVGDWTTGDPAIGRFLESHGRSGVPLYLFYSQGREPEILPQVLTPGMLTALGS